MFRCYYPSRSQESKLGYHFHAFLPEVLFVGWIQKKNVRLNFHFGKGFAVIGMDYFRTVFGSAGLHIFFYQFYAFSCVIAEKTFFGATAYCLKSKTAGAGKKIAAYCTVNLLSQDAEKCFFHFIAGGSHLLIGRRKKSAPFEFSCHYPHRFIPSPKRSSTFSLKAGALLSCGSLLSMSSACPFISSNIFICLTRSAT